MPTERQDEARSSFGIWAIVDAAGEMLYGSNVRQEVEAEYERRLAADPRLVRVLRIAELDISFAGRGEAEEEGEEQTICVLPWLPLDEPLRFGAVRVDHWTEARRGLPDDVCQTADALLAGFRDHHGGEIDPVVCWLDGQPPAEKLSTVDVDRVRMHTFVLTLAGIAENTYLHDYEQLNASHCRRVFLHFRVGRPEIRTTRRRREGWAISRLRYSRVLLARPLAAEGRPTAAG